MGVVCLAFYSMWSSLKPLTALLKILLASAGASVHSLFWSAGSKLLRISQSLCSKPGKRKKYSIWSISTTEGEHDRTESCNHL